MFALDGWKVDDTFLAGSELQRFRILAIDTEAPRVSQDTWTQSGSSRHSRNDHAIRGIARHFGGGRRNSDAPRAPQALSTRLGDRTEYPAQCITRGSSRNRIHGSVAPKRLGTR